MAAGEKPINTGKISETINEMKAVHLQDRGAQVRGWGDQPSVAATETHVQIQIRAKKKLR